MKFFILIVSLVLSCQTLSSDFIIGNDLQTKLLSQTIPLLTNSDKRDRYILQLLTIANKFKASTKYDKNSASACINELTLLILLNNSLGEPFDLSIPCNVEAAKVL
ncbi:hypothetical protein CH361_18760 [Leptospira brenneri]|nr:hypothetical protein CH361_18760 [Leptospira brenneri]